MNLDFRRRATDPGFTLIEAVICIALMGILSTVIAAAVVVTLKTSPAVANRADTAINVQGLVTWLPQDVDSAAPGAFDTTQGSTSGCPGTDPGVINVLKLTWREQITSTTNYAVSYRYVPVPAPAVGGIIYRVYCTIGNAPSVYKVTGILPPWSADPVKVIVTDSPADPDALSDSAKIIVKPLVGSTITIDAASKNPGEVLSTSTTTSPPPTTSSPPPANTAPTASDSTATVVVGTSVSITASAFDGDGNPLTLEILTPPSGWTVTKTTGLSMTVQAPAAGSGVISFRVVDSLGAASSPATITVTATAPAGNQPPSAGPSSGSTRAGVPVTVPLVVSDPENGALTAAVTSTPLPAGWLATVSGTNVTVTPSTTATAATTTLNYRVTDPGGATATSTLAITVTGPPPCVIGGPTLSRTSVPVKNTNSNPDALEQEVTVTITIVSGYCVGLNLRYDTGGPNTQSPRTFSDTGTTRSITLPKHNSPELWSVGPHLLEVRDSTSTTIGSTTLTVTK